MGSLYFKVLCAGTSLPAVEDFLEPQEVITMDKAATMRTLNCNKNENVFFIFCGVIFMTEVSTFPVTQDQVYLSNDRPKC